MGFYKDVNKTQPMTYCFFSELHTNQRKRVSTIMEDNFIHPFAGCVEVDQTVDVMNLRLSDSNGATPRRAAVAARTGDSGRLCAELKDPQGCSKGEGNPLKPRCIFYHVSCLFVAFSTVLSVIF